MQFPSSYFEDEVRDGFYVSGMMKRAWAAQLEVLEDIDKVCKKHNIKYFAEWGTMLGAVRHGGFVPWDDDMDIGMLREDYEKFCQVALDDLPEIYELLNFEHSDDGEYRCDDYLTRVYTGNRIRMDKAYLEKFHGFPYVAGMDVFPIDYMAPTQKDDEMLCEQITILTTVAQSIDLMESDEKEKYLEDLEAIFDAKFDRNRSLRRQIYMLSDRLCGMFSEKDAEYVTSMALRTQNDYKVPKKCYQDVMHVPFEITTIPIPIGYDTILSIKYHDYMKSVRDGGAHEYPFYKRQEDFYEQSHAPLFKKYRFSKDDLYRTELDEAGSLKSIAQNMLQIFGAAHTDMCHLALTGDWQTITVLCEDCQDGAIALGTKMEEVKGEGYSAVKLLEEYCEILYTIHETILSEGEIDDTVLKDILDDILGRMTVEIDKQLLARKEVVFLPFKGETWNAMESVWKAASQDENTDVYVIPIPFYEKNNDGSMGMMHFDLNAYPKNLPITDYNTFDFGLHRPDVIFFQNPYDEYNAAITVHPFFYAKNLKNYTEKLVYIPYFLIDEIKPSDERAVKTLEYFCTVPGVVHADRVIVQSEQMKNTYVNALTEFAGAETKSIWEYKICGLGSPIQDSMYKGIDKNDLPKDWQRVLYDAEGKKKKAVLYATGLGTLLEHEEKMLEKIEKTFAIFQEQKDIALVWRPHPGIRSAIEKANPQLWEKYQELQEKYCSGGWGILDDTPDASSRISLYDAYYGDTSDLVQAFKKFGLPVMIQNISI